jgi:hypothetical protein
LQYFLRSLHLHNISGSKSWSRLHDRFIHSWLKFAT